MGKVKNVGGRPRKRHEDCCRNGRMSVNLPPEVAARVRWESDEMTIHYSTFVRLLILKEFKRLDKQRKRAALNGSL